MGSIADHDAERAVLGSVLSGEPLESARELLPSDFDLPAHQRIWESMLYLLGNGVAIDEVTVSTRLKEQGRLTEAGGPQAIMAMSSSIQFARNLKNYVETVRDRSLRRTIVEKCRKTALAASNFNADAQTVSREGSDALARISASGALEMPSLEIAFAEVLDDLDAIAKGLKVGIIKTGIAMWDEMLGGLPMSYLTMIGAYPSVGKSALKNRMVINLARAGVKVATFEMEDPVKALVYRHVARETGMPIRKLKTERLPEWLMLKVGEVIERDYPWAKNCVYQNSSGLSVDKAVTMMRQLIIQRGVQVFFFDHMGRIDYGTKYGRFDLDVEKGIDKICEVAKEANVATVGLQHFHRPKGQSDAEPMYMRPTSSLWKNSGGFEQAARVAVGLWRQRDVPAEVVCTVTKQTEGRRDFDFTMMLNESAGLIEPEGGRSMDGETGYTQTAKSHWGDQ